MSTNDSSADAGNQPIPPHDLTDTDRPDPQFEAFRRRRAVQRQEAAKGGHTDGQPFEFSSAPDVPAQGTMPDTLLRGMTSAHSCQGAPSSRAGTKRPVNLLSKAIAILSRQECSEEQLRRKLIKYSHDISQIDHVIARLQHENWQSDERFAQAFLNSHEQRWGNTRILNALSDHKLDEEVMQDLRAQLKDSEYERALAVWTKKFQNKPCRDLKDKTKQLRFMASRGFSADVSYRIVNENCNF